MYIQLPQHHFSKWIVCHWIFLAPLSNIHWPEYNGLLWGFPLCSFQFFFFIVDDMQMWLLRELMARTGITGYRERSIWHSGFEHTEDMKEFLSELTLTRISHSFWQTFTNLIGREWFPCCCLNLHVFDYTGSYTFFHMFVYCFAFLILWIICSCPLPIYLVWF